MKQAIWKVDPFGDFKFRGGQSPGQLTLRRFVLGRVRDRSEMEAVSPPRERPPDGAFDVRMAGVKVSEMSGPRAALDQESPRIS